MLEHVAHGQTRFLTPGVAPDPRGVLIGRFGVLLFPSLEGAVSWLRLYSAESALDELLPGLEIENWATPLKSRVTAIRIPAASSYTLDRAARCARLAGGRIYTGTSKHFVKYRDDRSPYGYDAAELAMPSSDCDFVCHGEDFVQTYKRVGEISFERLLLRLSLRRVPGKIDVPGELLVMSALGLSQGVVHYLWRNRVAAEAALIRPRAASTFEQRDRSDLMALRVYNLPDRILDLFLATPGIDVFQLITDHVAVEVGYAHPIDLTSCASVFSPETFTLFWGERDRVDVIEGALQTTSIDKLTRVDIKTDEPKATPSTFKAEEPATIGVELRLERSLSPPKNVRATLIPEEQHGWLKKLVFLLPQASLQGHRMALTERGILVFADDNIDVVPLGQLLVSVADRLLVPLGMDLVPRVSEEVLSLALGHGPGLITVFPSDGGPFQIKESDLVPLERRSLARLEVTNLRVQSVGAPAHEVPEIKNDPVGRFALWGFADPTAPRQKALPPPRPGDKGSE